MLWLLKFTVKFSKVSFYLISYHGKNRFPVYPTSIDFPNFLNKISTPLQLVLISFYTVFIYQLILLCELFVYVLCSCNCYKLNVNFINLYEASGVTVFAGIFFSLTRLLNNQFYFILGDK